MTTAKLISQRRQGAKEKMTLGKMGFATLRERSSNRKEVKSHSSGKSLHSGFYSLRLSRGKLLNKKPVQFNRLHHSVTPLPITDALGDDVIARPHSKFLKNGSVDVKGFFMSRN